MLFAVCVICDRIWVMITHMVRSYTPHKDRGCCNNKTTHSLFHRSNAAFTDHVGWPHPAPPHAHATSCVGTSDSVSVGRAAIPPVYSCSRLLCSYWQPASSLPSHCTIPPSAPSSVHSQPPPGPWEASQLLLRHMLSPATRGATNVHEGHLDDLDPHDDPAPHCAPPAARSAAHEHAAP